MRKIGFHIQKGGVGKTSISGNLAAIIAGQGHKTIIVDCDPQGNVSSWFCTKSLRADIADVLAGNVEAAQAVIDLSDTLSLLPVIAIGGSLKKWSETELVQSPRAFEFLITDLAKLGFEYAVFDCSPSFSQLERAVIASLDEVINPLSPEFFSVDGIEIFTHELEKIEKANRKRITNRRIVVNMLNKSFTRHRAFFESLQKLNYEVFMIPQDSKIAESQIAHQSVAAYDPHARSIPALENLAAALLSDHE